MIDKHNIIKFLINRSPKIISPEFLEQARFLGEICDRSPGNYVSNWFKDIDILISIEDHNSVVGSFAGRFFSKDILYLPVALLHPQYQNKKFAKRAITSIIRNYTLWIIIHCPWKLFSAYLIIFRTQNPRVYRSWIGRNMKVYPNKETKLDILSLQKVKQFVSLMWPAAKFDLDDLILHGAYKETPSMIYSSDNIPWSDDKEVDVFFEDKLKLTNETGDAFVMVIERRFITF